MSEIKVGDKVRCVDAHDLAKLTKGKIYTITKNDGERLLPIAILDDKGEEWYLSNHMFEPITDTDTFSPDKSFLIKHKDEYVVKYSNGVTELLTESCIERKNNNLTDEYSKLFNIDKIYRLVPVWTRPTKQLTVDELKSYYEEKEVIKVEVRE